MLHILCFVDAEPLADGDDVPEDRLRPFRDSTSLADDGPALFERAQRDGYLFLRGLLPVRTLELVRRRFLEILRDEGYIRADSPLDSGIADPDGLPSDRAYQSTEVYRRLYAVREFHALQLHPNLLRVMGHLLQSEVVAHPSIIARVIFPQRVEYTTPAHQDYVHVQGAADTYTAWFPLSDLPPEMGGLAVAEGSHRGGVSEYRAALGAGGMEVTDDLEGKWVSNTFRQGDVVIFYSLSVHRGLPNTSGELRLSVDGRYQSPLDPFKPEILEPHLGMMTWEDVYAGWPDDPVKYYWHKWPIRKREGDPKFLASMDRVTLRQIENGTLDHSLRGSALGSLRRIIETSGDPDERSKAEQLLPSLEEASDRR